MNTIKKFSPIRAFLFCIVLLFSFLLCQNDNLPKIKFKDMKNKKVVLETFYEDGPIAVNVWNLACEPCIKEMKYLDEFNQKYKDQGFEVVSINIDTPRSMSKVKSFVKSKNYSFTVLSDPKAEFFRKTGGKVMPYLLLVNKDGTIYKRHVGFNIDEAKKLENEIVEMIAKNSPEIYSSKDEEVNNSNEEKVNIEKEAPKEEIVKEKPSIESS